jgi:hypothetical protein
LPSVIGTLPRPTKRNPYFWYGSEIEKQTEYVLWKLAKTAEAAGTTLDRTVKADVYIGDPSDYAGMEKVWKRWFPKNPPARCVIPYMGLGGKGSRVEIALTLLASDSKLKAETIETGKAPKRFSHASRQVSNFYTNRRRRMPSKPSSDRMVVHVEGTDFQKSRAYSPAIVTQGGKRSGWPVKPAWSICAGIPSRINSKRKRGPALR